MMQEKKFTLTIPVEIGAFTLSTCFSTSLQQQQHYISRSDQFPAVLIQHYAGQLWFQKVIISHIQKLNHGLYKCSLAGKVVINQTD